MSLILILQAVFSNPYPSLCPKPWTLLADQLADHHLVVIPAMEVKVASIAPKNVFLAWWRGVCSTRHVQMCEITAGAIIKLTNPPSSILCASNFQKIWILIMSQWVYMEHIGLCLKSG